MRMSADNFMAPALIALTDEDRGVTAKDQLSQMPAGGMVLIRRRNQEHALDDAQTIATTAARQGVLVSVSLNKPPKSVTSLPIDGVHIPEHGLKNWRRVDLMRLSPRFISASAHGWVGIRRAAQAGVDAVLLSAVFATQSHPNQRALGLYRFATLVEAAPIPIYALGGMTFNRSRRTAAVGSIGIAGIGIFAASGQAD